MTSCFLGDERKNRMKKLLFAIAGAASFAALAADPEVRTGDIDVLGFENFDLTLETVTGAVVDRTDSGVEGTSKWSCSGDDASLVKPYGGDNATAPSITEPAPFAGETNTKYLALDTNGSELQRAIPAAGQTVAADGTYVDTLVQFTPSESAPTSTDLDGAKLAIWLGVDSEHNTTNLMVAGAYYMMTDPQDESTLTFTTSTNYTLSGTYVPGTWYRLTIKAISSLANGAVGQYLPGFVVSIDGQTLSIAGSATDSPAYTILTEGGLVTGANKDLLDDNQFIPALGVSDTTVVPTLTSVGFKGTGALDDFVVTTVAPDFTPAAISLTLTWTPAEVTGVSYVLESDPATTNVVTSGTAVLIPAAAIGTNVTLIATFESGYEFDYLDIGGYQLQSLTFPVPSVSTNATLVAKAAAAYPTYVGEDAALKSQYDTWKATNGADSQSAYEKQFLLNVAPGTTVADDALVIESIAENATAGWDIVVSTTVSGAALSDGSSTTYNGYLLVKAANDLAGLSTATPVAYPVTAVTGGKVSITVTAGKFMKVVLTTTAPAQN